MDNDNTTLDDNCQDKQITTQSWKDIETKIIASVDIPPSSRLDLRDIINQVYPDLKTKDGRTFGLIFGRLVRLWKIPKDNEVASNFNSSKPLNLADQYIILRESLFSRAQAGDTRAVVDWCALTAQERASDDVPPELVADAVAALRGMGAEYAATLPPCCGAAVNALIERAVSPLLK